MVSCSGLMGPKWFKMVLYWCGLAARNGLTDPKQRIIGGGLVARSDLIAIIDAVWSAAPA